MKVGNLSSHKILKTQLLALSFISTFIILSNPGILICSCPKGRVLNLCNKVYIHFIRVSGELPFYKVSTPGNYGEVTVFYVVCLYFKKAIVSFTQKKVQKKELFFIWDLASFWSFTKLVDAFEHSMSIFVKCIHTRMPTWTFFISKIVVLLE